MARALYCVLIISMTIIMSVDGCGRRRRRIRYAPAPDTTKPSITCPGDISVISDKKQIYSAVKWTEPTASDNRDGSITPTRTGLGPGSVFYETERPIRISYSAKDRSGNYNECSFAITVNVIRCPEWAPKNDGWKSCDPSHDMLRGTTCVFGCYAGHELIGPNSVTCMDTGDWETATQPYCEKMTCQRELPDDDKTSITCSDSNNYRSICSYACAPGFAILPGHPRVRMCSAEGTWTGSVPRCVDVSPPEYTDCPAILIGYAERSKTSGRVVWNHPNFDDNDGAGYVISTQVSGPKPGTELDVGEHGVSYVAHDQTGNSGTCDFKVIVKQISCHALYPLPYTSIVCPGGRRYGSSCMFSCKNGTAMTGHDYAQCEKEDNGNVPYGHWSFGNKQPYCTLVSLCAKPSPPSNGALACDTWAGGHYCQLLCTEGFILPQRDALLLCRDSTGTWDSLGEDQVSPDCSKSNSFLERFYKLEQHFYYDGDCESAREEIQAKFLVALETELGDICSQYSQCTIGGVEVTCGDTDNRRKRSDTSNLIIKADLKKVNNGSVVEMFNERNTLIESMQANVGVFALVTESGSAVLLSTDLSQPTFTCPDGFYADTTNSFKCVECMSGSYQEETQKACSKCPRGQYQPDGGQKSCIKCPDKTTTEREGAVHWTECKEACSAGFASATGTVPCSPCESGTFTGDYGAISCQPCPGSTTTRPPSLSGGALSQQECYDFDVEYPVLEEAYQHARVLANTENGIRDLFVSFWVKCRARATASTVMSIQNEENTELMSVSNDQELVVAVGSCSHHSGVSLNGSSKWHHVFIKVTNQRTDVYMDGDHVYTNTVCVHTGMLVPVEERIYVAAGGDGFLGYISQLNIWSDFNTDTVKQFATTCFSDVSGDIVSWKSFEDSQGTFVIIRSKCDDHDNCMSEPCHNNGVCTDGLNSFSCVCLNGYTGDMCETNIDDCIDNSCIHGATCIDGVNGYTCLCQDDFKGTFCEIKLVDGSWAQWEQWGLCSVTCDDGIQMRSRVCTDPSPDNGGKYCEGEDTEQQTCSMPEKCHNECATDPSVLENGVINCTWTDDTNTTRVCYPQCNAGYDFDDDLYLNEIVCGRETGNTWNIRNEDNPDAQLPMCTKIGKADINVLNYTAEYTDLTSALFASQTGVTTTTLTDIVSSATTNIECVKNGNCPVKEIAINNLEDHGLDREKREIQLIGFSIQISCNPLTGINECFDLLTEVKNLLDTYVNRHLFTVQIDDVIYDVDNNRTYIDGMTVCDEGKVPVYYYCVPCGSGSYAYTQYCKRCTRGYYQDEVGMSYCKQCPDGWTTSGLQSRNIAQCDINVTNSKERYMTYITIAVVGVTCVVVLLVTIVSVCVYKRFCSQRVDQMPNCQTSASENRNAKYKTHTSGIFVTDFKNRAFLEEVETLDLPSGFNTLNNKKHHPIYDNYVGNFKY